jgi:uncharacterized surface protein with fasciclin (FAS1) repeats
MSFPTPAVVLAALVMATGVVAGCERSDAPDAQIESTAPPSLEAAQTLVGPGCAAYAEKYATGPGSILELADKPVAEAIEDHPMLRLFSSAISGDLNERVDLTQELDGGEFTIFAPTDDAFSAKVPKQWTRTLAAPKSANALTDLLRFHIVDDEQAPGDLSGSLETSGGEKLTIERDGDRIRIADQANVVCGGLRTANATIYLIDSVLMPPSQVSSSEATPTATPTTAAP